MKMGALGKKAAVFCRFAENQMSKFNHTKN